jgi:hypothetical protein
VDTPIPTAEPILEYVRRRLNDCRGEWPRIAERTKLPYDTIAKIAQGKRPNPTLDSIQPIVDYFRELDAMVERLRHGGPEKAVANG